MSCNISVLFETDVFLFIYFCLHIVGSKSKTNDQHVSYMCRYTNYTNRYMRYQY